MSDALESLAASLQAEIDANVRHEMGEVVYQRWQNPLYMGVLTKYDATACIRGTCGDQMQIYLKFSNGRVSDVSFQTDGCGHSVVAASFAAEMALHKTPQEALAVDAGKILTAAGGLPEDREHCAFLAAETLHEAVNNYLQKIGTKKHTHHEGRL